MSGSETFLPLGSVMNSDGRESPSTAKIRAQNSKECGRTRDICQQHFIKVRRGHIRLNREDVQIAEIIRLIKQADIAPATTAVKSSRSEKVSTSSGKLLHIDKLSGIPYSPAITRFNRGSVVDGIRRFE